MKLLESKYSQRFLPLEHRFWWKVAKVGAGEDECWEWRSNVLSNGYGQFDQRCAHRVAYELAVGPIPDGHQIDHLCRNRACVRPDHLEAVTPRENQLRAPTSVMAKNLAKTHCPQDHSYEDHGAYARDGSRYCKVCRQAWTREWRRRKKS